MPPITDTARVRPAPADTESIHAEVRARYA